MHVPCQNILPFSANYLLIFPCGLLNNVKVAIIVIIVIVLVVVVLRATLGRQRCARTATGQGTLKKIAGGRKTPSLAPSNLQANTLLVMINFLPLLLNRSRPRFPLLISKITLLLLTQPTLLPLLLLAVQLTKPFLFRSQNKCLFLQPLPPLLQK